MREGFFFVIFLIALWISGILIFINNIPKKNDDVKNADAIIVLTGNKGRLKQGIKLLAQNKAKKMFISGVGKNVTLEQIVSLSNELSIDEFKKYKDIIVLDHSAKNTKQNAIESNLWMNSNKYKSMIIVTCNYHMPRSIKEFSFLMPDYDIIPFSVENINLQLNNIWKLKSFKKIWLIIREYNKYIATMITHLFENDELI